VKCLEDYWACLQQQANTVIDQAISEMGFQDFHALTLVNRTVQGNLMYVPIQPLVMITVVSARTLAAYASIPNINLEVEDLQVQGLPRTYSKDQLLGATYYLIDAVVPPAGGDPEGGYKVTRVSNTTIRPKSESVWGELLVRRDRANRERGI
jgi:hypothetical protein